MHLTPNEVDPLMTLTSRVEYNILDMNNKDSSDKIEFLPNESYSENTHPVIPLSEGHCDM